MSEYKVEIELGTNSLDGIFFRDGDFFDGIIKISDSPKYYSFFFKLDSYSQDSGIVEVLDQQLNKHFVGDLTSLDSSLDLDRDGYAGFEGLISTWHPSLFKLGLNTWEHKLVDFYMYIELIKQKNSNSLYSFPRVLSNKTH